MADDKKRTIGILATIASAMYYGITPIMVLGCYSSGASTMTVVFLRFLVVVPVLFVVLKIRGTNLKLTATQFRDIGILTVAGQGATTILLFSAYTLINTGTATTIHFLYPVMTLVLAVVFYKGKLTKTKLICIALCMLGIILFYDGDAGISNQSTLGLLLAFISSITYAFYTVYLEHSSVAKVDTLVIIFYLDILASVIMGIVAAVRGELSLSFGFSGWIYCLLLSVGNTFIGFVGYRMGIQAIGAENTTMLSTMEPVTCILIGVLVRNEGFTAKTIVGTIAILLSTLIIAKAKEEQMTPEELKTRENQEDQGELMNSENQEVNDADV